MEGVNLTEIEHGPTEKIKNLSSLKADSSKSSESTKYGSYDEDFVVTEEDSEHEEDVRSKLEELDEDISSTVKKLNVSPRQNRRITRLQARGGAGSSHKGGK